MRKELEKLEKKKNTLLKRHIDLIVTDFDDTIFSTKELLESDIRKWKRWNEWNIYIKEVIWIDKFINQFYDNKKFPNTIVSKLRKSHDLILTAGFKEIQEAKLKNLWIHNFNYKVVYEAEEKIIELIKYVINTLEYIPHKITIYEDKPHFFIENKKLIEEFLWTELEIMFVEMENNEKEPNITKIA